MAGIKPIIVIVFFVLIAVDAAGQVNRYMIFFKDKSGTAHTVNNPATFLSEAAVQRRLKQNVTITYEDLPVTQSYVQAVRNTGVKLLYTTKWMNGVLIACTEAQLTDVNLLPFVDNNRTERVAPGDLPAGRVTKSNKLAEAQETNDETTDAQLAMLGIDTMHEDGFHGEGITIAVLDGGFLGVNTVPAFQDLYSNRFNASASYDFTRNESNVFRYSEHGTNVLSVMGVHSEGQFTGGAYKASFQLYITEDVGSEYRVEEYYWLFAAERADSAGVDLINSSLGYNTFDDPVMDYTTSQMDGQTPVITRAAQTAVAKGMLVVNSAGNSGADVNWKIITAPADGNDVLAVGNVNLAGFKSITSSIGPSADGRIKPDVVALGTSVSVIKANGSLGLANGTSLSAPLTTALVAGLMQKYPDLNRLDLADAIRKSSSQATAPDNSLGYGIPHYRAVSQYMEVTNVQPEQHKAFKVYPNPVTGTVWMSPKNSAQLHIDQVILSNAQGQILFRSTPTYNWPDQTYSLNMQALTPGVYFLRIQTGSRVEVHKLIRH